MIANYGDVIPRRDFEQLQKDHVTIQETVDQQKADYDKLKEEHEWVCNRRSASAFVKETHNCDTETVSLIIRSNIRLYLSKI